MKLTRRNTVIGLAALAGGAGAINATGAFDSVEANRSFDVAVQSDENALLGISVNNEVIASTTETEDGNDIIQFTLDTDEIEGGENTGLNENSVTEFYNVFGLTNNGSQDVQLSTEMEDLSGVTFFVRGDRGDNSEVGDIESGDEIDLSSDSAPLPAGDTVVVDVQVNTEGEDGYTEPEAEDDVGQVTIIAETDTE